MVRGFKRQACHPPSPLPPPIPLPISIFIILPTETLDWERERERLNNVTDSRGDRRGEKRKTTTNRYIENKNRHERRTYAHGIMEAASSLRDISLLSLSSTNIYENLFLLSLHMQNMKKETFTLLLYMQQQHAEKENNIHTGPKRKTIPHTMHNEQQQHTLSRHVTCYIQRLH